MEGVQNEPTEGYKAVTFYFKVDALTSLDLIKEAIGARSRADVIRQALECFADKKMAEARKNDQGSK